jgi:hypothetical protein
MSRVGQMMGATGAFSGVRLYHVLPVYDLFTQRLPLFSFGSRLLTTPTSKCLYNATINHFNRGIAMENMMNSIMGGTAVIIVISLVITVVVLFFVFRLISGMMRGAKQTREILTTGVPAQARILQLGETGMYVNNNPAVDILLEVHPQGRPPYQVQTRMVVSMIRLPAIQPGNIVPVKYDPADPTKVAIAI